MFLINLERLKKYKDDLPLAAFLAPRSLRRKLIFLYLYLIWNDLEIEKKEEIKSKTTSVIGWTLIVLFILGQFS